MYTAICAECGHKQILDGADFDPICDECGATEFEHQEDD